MTRRRGSRRGSVAEAHDVREESNHDHTLHIDLSDVVMSHQINCYIAMLLPAYDTAL
jgi:hypothetical protein